MSRMQIASKTVYTLTDVADALITLTGTSTLKTIFWIFMQSDAVRRPSNALKATGVENQVPNFEHFDAQ